MPASLMVETPAMEESSVLSDVDMLTSSVMVLSIFVDSLMKDGPPVDDISAFKLEKKLLSDGDDGICSLMSSVSCLQSSHLHVFSTPPCKLLQTGL